MSGRRRRDDGWDEGRQDRDAPGSRPDPWADGGADGGQGRGYPAPSFQPASEQATSYDIGGRAGNGYDSSDYDAPGYDGGRAGYGGQNGSANGYQNGSANGYQSAQPASGYGQGGYGDSGYGQGGYGYGNDSGYGGRAGFADANGATAFVPEFMSAEADDAPAGTPRPIGRLSIYTLLDDRVAEFDRLAERAAEGVRTTEPDTLVYVIHVVPKAPLQRIVYEIYRDRTAFESHERQPHIRRFMADRAPCVLATNIIDLRLKYAKVAALGASPAADAAGQSQPGSRSAGPSAALADQTRSDQYAGAQYGNGSQYNGSQYNGSQYGNGGQYGNGSQYGAEPAATVARPQYQAPAAAAPAAAPAAASFTPATEDRYAAAASQYAAAAAGQYAPTSQYGYTGSGQAANGGQYPAAAEYPATSGYADAAGYPATGYQATATYQANGGYAAGGGYSGGAGYSGAAGYQGGEGYSGANGYSASNGYSGTTSSASFTPASSAGSAGGQYQEPAGQPAAGSQVAVRRYRELGAGAPSDSDAGHQAAGATAGGGYSGSDQDTSRSDSAEWSPPGYSDQRYRSS
ncbi:MAG TPA: antibiotic biosynthesis monooxygenase [Trebonia sp.]|nr:antibiotic biosynthesis monooxygenase [Trebonia sp.]